MSEKKTDEKKPRPAESELQEDKQALDKETAKKLEQGKAEIMKVL